jgi:hydroxymethylbilane synthase
MLGQDHAAVEVFGVVADPATGKTIRIHELADSAETDPDSLGKLVARKLIEAGAGSLIQLTAEAGVSVETSAEAAI